MCLIDISKLSESFVTIASFFLELLKKISAAGKNDPPPDLNRVKKTSTSNLIIPYLMWSSSYHTAATPLRSGFDSSHGYIE